MKTLILNGSPRPAGDTAGLLKLLREKLRGEVKTVDAYRRDISPCVDCRYCREHPGCAIRDEMQEVYSWLEDCDNVVIASPIYFSQPTGRLLDVGSRLQTYYCARRFRGEAPVLKAKRGAVILVGGGDGRPERAYETAKVLLRHMNCRDVFDPVCSHHTDTLPAVEDAQAVEGVKKIAAFLNGDEGA
ncbi:MAG: flavodoxin family protein [Oscillospiraceae bacterium]|nr:flavodoxin family protein [Oscillospiraceae bacterium]